MPILIRNLTSVHIDTASSVINAAFGGSGSGRIADLQRFLEIEPDGWFAAWEGDQIVGTVGAVNYGPFAWIGMMTVRPDYQRRGIGHLLMERVLSWLDTRGCPMVRLDATVAGAGLYRQLGFTDNGLILALDLPQPDRQPWLPDGVEPLRLEDIPAAVDFDAPIFGARRERIFRAYVEDYPERSFLSRSPAGEITGLCIAQEQKIGPWTCSTPQAAERLLQAVLSLPFERGLRVMIPVENGDGAALLATSGFSNNSDHIHMRRGGHRLPGDRSRIYGQASYGVG